MSKDVCLVSTTLRFMMGLDTILFLVYALGLQTYLRHDNDFQTTSG